MVDVVSEVAMEIGEAIFLDRKPTLPQRCSEWCSKKQQGQLKALEKGVQRRCHIYLVFKDA